MAGAFLADTLRQQAAAEMRGQMLQDQISSQVARQIIGQIAQQEIGQSMQSVRGRGQAIQSAADQASRREVGMTQLEMQKEQARQEKQLGLITAAASATGALGAHFAMQEPGLPDAPTDADVRAAHSPMGQQEVSPGVTVQDVLEKQRTYGAVADIDLEGEMGLQSTLVDPLAPPPDPYAELDDEEFLQSISNF